MGRENFLNPKTFLSCDEERNVEESADSACNTLLPERTEPSEPTENVLPFLTDDVLNSDIADLSKVVFQIVGAYYKALVPALRACLAVVASLALKGRTLPLSLILEGFSGFGKTAVLQMLFATALQPFIYRSDKFTPKSFVSHAANVKRKDLAGIDLLPRLDRKVLVTKELAPMFRGRMEELMETFSQLCTVLDGKGLTTDSGMQGQRGYKKYIIFNWLGATTPVPPDTHQLMYQLGTRLLFYQIDAVQPTREQLLAYMKEDRSQEAEEETKKAVKQLVTEFFDEFPVDSVEPEDITIHDDLMLELVCWAEMVAAGRAELKREKHGYDIAAVASNPPEAAYKIGTYFKQLARGSALIHGRSRVNASDIRMVAHVAISSIPCCYRPILRAFRKQKTVTSTEAAELCHVSPPTARKYLLELSFLGFGTLKKGHKKTEENPVAEPDTLIRAAKYDWMQNGVKNA